MSCVDCTGVFANDFLSLSGYVIGFVSATYGFYKWVWGRKLDKEMKKQLYQESQKLINEQQRVMDEGSDIGIHEEIAGEVYRILSERKSIIDESVKFVDNSLEMKVVGKKNFAKFREIVRDSNWMLSNFQGEDMHEIEQIIEKKWGLFKQRMNNSINNFREIESEYKAKKIIA